MGKTPFPTFFCPNWGIPLDLFGRSLSDPTPAGLMQFPTTSNLFNQLGHVVILEKNGCIRQQASTLASIFSPKRTKIRIHGQLLNSVRHKDRQISRVFLLKMYDTTDEMCNWPTSLKYCPRRTIRSG